MTLRKLRINKNQEGFTLIELMIVIAIIGILAAIAIPNFISYRDKAFCSAAESDANAITAAIADYFAIPENTQIQQITTPTDQPQIGSASYSDIVTMSGSNLATVVDNAAGDGYIIVVTDGSLRCPAEYVSSQQISQGEGWGGTAGSTAYFQKTM